MNDNVLCGPKQPMRSAISVGLSFTIRKASYQTAAQVRRFGAGRRARLTAHLFMRSRGGRTTPPVFPALPANPSGVTLEASCECDLQMFYLLCVRSVTRMQKVSQTAAAA